MLTILARKMAILRMVAVKNSISKCNKFVLFHVSIKEINKMNERMHKCIKSE